MNDVFTPDITDATAAWGLPGSGALSLGIYGCAVTDTPKLTAEECERLEPAELLTAIQSGECRALIAKLRAINPAAAPDPFSGIGQENPDHGDQEDNSGSESADSGDSGGAGSDGSDAGDGGDDGGPNDESEF